MDDVETGMSVIDLGGYESKYVLPTSVAILVFKAMVADNVYKYNTKYVADKYVNVLYELPPGTITLTNISAGQVLQGRLNFEDQEKEKGK